MRNALNGHAVGLSESWRKILGKNEQLSYKIFCQLLQLRLRFYLNNNPVSLTDGTGSYSELIFNGFCQPKREKN